MRRWACAIGMGGAVVCATTASAQTTLAQTWTEGPPADAPALLDRQTNFDVRTDRGFGPALDFSVDLSRLTEASTPASPYVASTRRDIWHEGPGYTDRLRVQTRGTLIRQDGAPLPLGARDPAQLDVDAYDVSYTRGFPVARGYTASGLEVSLTPHLGVGMGSQGGSTEAGATLKIGSGLENMVKDGNEAFGDRPRWYLYAAGSGRAVGYNFARNRDGAYARSGVSHDSGEFLGDASIGVALRKGDMQGSFGIVYRELEAEGLRGGEGFDRDVTEGLVAFQLSIKPEW